VTTATTPAQPITDVSSPAAEGGLLVTVCFAGATFLGAFLLFLVQPLVAKYILPWFGGGAAVWTTCMLFFQAVLLGGYLYAHLGVKRLAPRAQAWVHVVVLLAAAAAALPAVIPAEHWKPVGDAAGQNPTPRILLLLAATVGLPCVVLSATSPLLQAWYSRLRPGAAVYRLYALSNLGSLLALLAYPVVVEPLLARKTQAIAWSIGMGSFAVLCAACALLAGRRAVVTSQPDEPEIEPVDAEAGPTALPVVRGILWLALPACASALLLATTNTITQDLAPVPFLWILPLTLYLLTFIIAFDRPSWYRRPVFAGALLLAVLGALFVLLRERDTFSIYVIIGAVVLPMFLGCMVLHGELYRLKPSTDRLTSYYLSIAAGGALGGLLVAVGAPMLLRSYAELGIALWVCCLLAYITPLLAERRFPNDIAGLLGIAIVTALAPVLWAASHRAVVAGTLLSRSRDFYGVLSVWEVNDKQGKGRLLQHGSITHGHQYVRPGLREVPTTYYHPETGIGMTLGEYSPLPKPRRVGLVGLGTGSIAAYGRAGDVYRFYEISPSVLRIAQERFTYLQDMKARGGAWQPVLGDARLSLERENDQNFDALALDAFSGDAIPVHLLTSEAFDLYKRHLNPSGVLCIHISNNYLDLQTVVAAAAKRLGWEAVLFESAITNRAGFASEWVMLSPDPARIAHFRRYGATRPPRETPGFRVWTDEYANLRRIIN
jgi:SAM-dependent methyltransferase